MKLLTESSAPSERPLVSAIIYKPADAPSWFVYADWLEEFGDPEQAAFVRRWLPVVVPILESLFLSTPTAAPRNFALALEIKYKRTTGGRCIARPIVSYWWVRSVLTLAAYKNRVSSQYCSVEAVSTKSSDILGLLGTLLTALDKLYPRIESTIVTDSGWPAGNIARR